MELADAIENIDIGGPSMVRSAAKNYHDVTIVVDQADYDEVLAQIKEDGETSLATRARLAAKAFRHTAAYDSLISQYLTKQTGLEDPEKLTLSWDLKETMRYGENSHQKAWLYEDALPKAFSVLQAKQLHGKKLSYNNIKDADEALRCIREFDEPTVVACKHGNPCGVGSGSNIYEAWKKAFEADRTSIFGGIVVCNREITEKMANEMKEIFLEVIVAPAYEEKALEILKQKSNLRILLLPSITVKQPEGSYDIKKINGGIILQTIDSKLLDNYEVVTNRKPTEKELEDMLFTWKIVKYTKSNGIALGKDKQSIGIGPGQVNRIWATKQSIEHANELIGEGVTKGAVLASDAFFPFSDCVEAAHEAGITAIIQPGGAKKDQESIDKCNEYGMAMIFTGMRHFRH